MSLRGGLPDRSSPEPVEDPPRSNLLPSAWRLLRGGVTSATQGSLNYSPPRNDITTLKTQFMTVWSITPPASAAAALAGGTYSYYTKTSQLFPPLAMTFCTVPKNAVSDRWEYISRGFATPGGLFTPELRPELFQIQSYADKLPGPLLGRHSGY